MAEEEETNIITPTVSLNVVNLHYLPRRDRLYQLIQLRDQLFSMKYVREFFPQVRFDVYNPTTLDGINFRAFQGEITAVLSNDKDELRTIIEFIVMNRLSGDFSGEILLDGVNNKRPYNRSYAFVPKVVIIIIILYVLMYSINNNLYVHVNYLL